MMSSAAPILAVIAARGGSKGLPGKNLLPLGGKPLVAWSVDAARGSKHINRLVISTDDPAIARAAEQAGCEAPFLRPAELATDEAPIEAALLHALGALGGNWGAIVLLQATSPFRTSQDIDGSLDLLLAHDAPSVIGVTMSPKPAHWLHSLDGQGRLAPLISGGETASRRQDLPSAYIPNGALYAARLPWFLHSKRFYAEEALGFVMPPERSVDIDTRLDYIYAQALLEAGLVSPSKETCHDIRIEGKFSARQDRGGEEG
ncbi:N-acylneuraminate cytidylyltransferase [Rhodospirillaceae bacterium LM-1]|nr:N-acylneuraminate cytidylyltransferase [Rhodospirillaceae bacterium LM-1]